MRTDGHFVSEQVPPVEHSKYQFLLAECSLLEENRIPSLSGTFPLTSPLTFSDKRRVLEIFCKVNIEKAVNQRGKGQGMECFASYASRLILNVNF